MEGGIPDLLAAALRLARTHLTSSNVPCGTEEIMPVRSEPVRTRARRAAQATAAQTANRHHT